MEIFVYLSWMPAAAAEVANGLLLYGQQVDAGLLTRRELLKLVGVENSTFRSAGEDFGSTGASGGLRFFDSTRARLRFGPGAGLVLAVAIGASSLRAALVDANGILHHQYEAGPQPEQTELPPTLMLDRIGAAAAAVLEPAFKDDSLLVDGALPFLGLAVAWAAPIDRSGRPVGALLRNPTWQSAPLSTRVADRLGLPRERSHTFGIAGACAIATAWLESRTQAARDSEHPSVQMVVRLGGTVDAASIVVEPPRGRLGPVSGFIHSILMGGADGLAGSIGHLPVDRGLLAELNKECRVDLAALAPYGCSCGAANSIAHLEAFASTRAVARRLNPRGSEAVVLAAIMSDPDAPAHDRALFDVGSLVGRALTGPSAMLNPSAIILAGPLALPRVLDGVVGRVVEARLLGTFPEFRLLESEDNRFLAVQGAGLAVLRHHVFRRFEDLIGGPRKQCGPRIERLTNPLRADLWQTDSNVGGE